MRILQVIEFFTPKMGGSVQVAYQIARHLCRRGHEVTVWSSDFASGDFSFPDMPFRAVLFPSVMSRWGFHVTPTLVGWARRHLKEFDVVHMHNVRTFQNLVVGGFARRYGVPYVLSAHGSLPIIVQRKAAKRAYDLLFGRRLIAGASCLIAVSPVEVEQYAEAGIACERIVLVPNGLDLDEFSRLPPRGTFRRKLGIPDETRVMLFLGRLHWRKGINYLIEAFARLQTRLSHSLLLVAGPDDGELARLQALTERLRLREQVWFIGPLYGEGKLAAYVDADVLASPAVHEIFGLVPFEALMCGTPVVVTDDCGSGQLIGEAQAGYLVSYGDVEALTAALLWALTNREEAMQMVKAGRTFIQQWLDWNVVVIELERLYSELLAR
ncbi:MAG: glycosyltransferase [Anaerolineae bacterium]